MFACSCGTSDLSGGKSLGFGVKHLAIISPPAASVACLWNGWNASTCLDHERMGLDGALLTEACVPLPSSCLPKMLFHKLRVDSKQQPGPQGGPGALSWGGIGIIERHRSHCTNELDILVGCPGSTSVSERQNQLSQVGNRALYWGTGTLGSSPVPSYGRRRIERCFTSHTAFSLPRSCWTLESKVQREAVTCPQGDSNTGTSFKLRGSEMKC